MVVKCKLFAWLFVGLCHLLQLKRGASVVGGCCQEVVDNFLSPPLKQNGWFSTPGLLFLSAHQLNPNLFSGGQRAVPKALAFPYFSEARLDHTVLANETQAEGFWESVCWPNACTTSCSFFLPFSSCLECGCKSGGTAATLGP